MEWIGNLINNNIIYIYIYNYIDVPLAICPYSWKVVKINMKLYIIKIT